MVDFNCPVDIISEVPTQDPQDTLICYNCTYVSVAGIEVGLNCNDPFDATGIAQIPCDGSCVVSAPPLAFTRSTLVLYLLRVNRSCCNH